MFNHQDKDPGDLILSADWNASMNEVARLETDKVNRQGEDTIVGPLTVEQTLSVKNDLQVLGKKATVNVETSQLLHLQRPVDPNVKHINSVGLFVGAFEPGISGKTRLDFMLSGSPAESNSWAGIPNVNVLTLQADTKVGIGVTDPKIHLAIGDNDTGLQQQGDGELAIYTNNTEKVRVSGNGNVGIGVTDPQINLAIGDHGTGLQQRGEGTLAICTKGNERVRIEDSGKVKVHGTVYDNKNTSSIKNYEIYLKGSATGSSEGDTPSLKINDSTVQASYPRGLNTAILHPSGSDKKLSNHDVYGTIDSWNTWAQWIHENAEDGDVIAVVSRDAVNPAPRGGAAEKLLSSILAIDAFAVVGRSRSPYALLFVKGQSNCVEISHSPNEANAHLITTYYSLLNNRTLSVVSGMIMMWSGGVESIPLGWALCNGRHGTPNLTDRFIVGAGGSYGVENTGGQTTTQLSTNQLPGHSHGYSMGSGGNHSHYLRRGSDDHNLTYAWGGDGGTETLSAARDDQSGPTVVTTSQGGHSHSLSIEAVGGGQAFTNLPPYYALAYIMKL